MPNDLLTDARERAERSDPPVRAAALLRIARVETAFDPIAARGTFERGLDATRRIPGREGNSSSNRRDSWGRLWRPNY